MHTTHTLGIVGGERCGTEVQVLSEAHSGRGGGCGDGGWRGGLWLVLLLLLVLVIIVLVIVLLGCGLGNDACMRTVGGMSHRVARTQSLGWACAVTDSA